MGNFVNFNKLFYSFLIVLSSLQAETKLGETRLGLEFTPISDGGYTASYNPKFKQKAKIFDNDVSVSIYNRHYIFDNGIEYNRIKLHVKAHTKYYVFFEGMYNFYNGDKNLQKQKSIVGLWYKSNSFITSRVGYTWKDKIDSDNEHSRSNVYAFIFTGNIFKIGKHKLSYENYNYKSIDTTNWDISLEVQYKYRIIDNVDLYMYSVNGYTTDENIHASRIDLGIYWYFK